MTSDPALRSDTIAMSSFTWEWGILTQNLLSEQLQTRCRLSHSSVTLKTFLGWSNGLASKSGCFGDYKDQSLDSSSLTIYDHTAQWDGDGKSPELAGYKPCWRIESSSFRETLPQLDRMGSDRSGHCMPSSTHMCT